MSLIEIFQRFPDHEACLEHLETVRWGDEPHCPYCGATHVARKDERFRAGRWNCHGCKSSFNVLAERSFRRQRSRYKSGFSLLSLF